MVAPLVEVVQSKEYVVVDTETTGLHSSDHVIEIGVIGNDDVKKDWIIYPDNYTICNSEFHGITTDYAIENGINRQQVLSEFLLFVEHYGNVYAYNASFDKQMLRNEYERNAPNELDRFDQLKWECVLRLSREQISPPPNGYKLINVYNQLFGCSDEQSHRALGDCEMTMRVLKFLKN